MDLSSSGNKYTVHTHASQSSFVPIVPIILSTFLSLRNPMNEYLLLNCHRFYFILWELDHFWLHVINN